MRLNILKMFKCLMARGTIFFDIANFYCHNKFAYVHNLRSITTGTETGVSVLHMVLGLLSED